MIKLLASL